MCNHTSQQEKFRLCYEILDCKRAALQEESENTFSRSTEGTWQSPKESTNHCQLRPFSYGVVDSGHRTTLQQKVTKCRGTKMLQGNTEQQRPGRRRNGNSIIKMAKQKGGERITSRGCEYLTAKDIVVLKSASIK